MFLARDFFGDSIAELKAWLDAHPKPNANITREERGSCTVLRPCSDRVVSWPEKVRPCLWASCGSNSAAGDLVLPPQKVAGYHSSAPGSACSERRAHATAHCAALKCRDHRHDRTGGAPNARCQVVGF